MTPDERIAWVKVDPGRKVAQIIEAAPCGLSVTTQYFSGDEKVRQDIAIIVDALPMVAGEVGMVA